MNTSIQTKRYVGTSVYGIRMPIITQGADIANIITNTIIEAQNSTYQPLQIDNQDIVAVTEAFLARAQGNYVSLQDIADDVSAKFPTGDVAVVFPILSRNRFAKILEGIAQGISGKVYVCLSYPTDEVGYPVMNEEALFELTVNPYTDTFDEASFNQKFGTYTHPITRINYIELYKNINPNIEIIFTNNSKDILKLTNQILVASIHARQRQKVIFENLGAKVFTLDQICNTPSNQHGWSEYGVLGSNYSNERHLKLFPRNAESFCLKLQKLIQNKTGKYVEVLIYGDGGFKCPQTKIWEFADPVVSPGFTPGLQGMPNEIKIKAVADNNPGNAEEAIIAAIKLKQKENLFNIGTTPRRIVDLVGSLCDLTTGSGDKGTPVVLIKGYFDNYTKGIPSK